MMIPNLEKSENKNDMNSVLDVKNNLAAEEFGMSVNTSADLSPYVNGENNENLNTSNSINFIDKNLESLNSSEESNFLNGDVSDSQDLKRSPDLFEDTSPKNISRYGRTRKPKIIADIYAIGSKFSPKYKSPLKGFHEKVKSPKGKKSPDKKNKSINLSYENSPKSSVPWNSAGNKSQIKVYVRKDLIQEKEDKEETESLMRSMFSPVKNGSGSTESTPEKVNQSQGPLDKIILKKSPKGIFECSPKKTETISTILNFDKESDCNENQLLHSMKEMHSSSLDEITEEESACGWTTGQLAWARVSGHPFWPCLITRDPDNRRFVRQKVFGRASMPSYTMHVTFFGDNGRHCWISKGLLMTFLGLDDFNMLKEGLTPELRKKDPKYCASFDVKAGKEMKWLAAVSEAECYLTRPINLREESLNCSLIAPPQFVKKPPKELKRDVSLSNSVFDSLFVSDNSQGYDSSDINSMTQPDFTGHGTANKVKKSRKKKLKGQTQLDKWVVKEKATLENGMIENSLDNEIKREIGDANISLDKLNDDSDFDDAKDVVKHEKSTINNVIKNSEHEIKLEHTDTDSESSESSDESDSGDDKNDKEYSPRKTRQSSELNGVTYKPRIKSSTPVTKRQRKSNIKPMENNIENSDEELSSSDCPKKTIVRNTSENNAKYQDADFLQFLELKKDAFMDENPDLEEGDILAYLYKIWQYGESQMLDEMKGNSVCLVKGMVDDVVNTTPPKRSRKNHNDDNYASTSPVFHREKTSRKNKIKSYFSNMSESSDSEFESNLETKPSSSSMVKNEKSSDDGTLGKDIAEMDNGINVISDYIDLYMEALKKPKPNIFKGMLKEKVCEICELPTNLVKCKGLCQGMFHMTCVQLQKDPGQSSDTSMNKRKKKRGRAKGWRSKKEESSTSIDCSVNNTNEDLSIKDSNDTDNNISIKNESIIVEPYMNGQVDIPPKLEIPKIEQDAVEDCKDNIVKLELPNMDILDDVDEFESKMSLKMMELIDSNVPIDIESDYLSSDECDWDSMQAGECVIVDFKYPRKRVEIKISPEPDPEDTFKCNHCTKYDQPLCFVCKSIVHEKTGSDFRQRCNIIHCHHFYHPECLKEWPQTKYSAGGLIKGSKNVDMEAISCPRHVCHTCVSDDPQGCKTRFSGVKLARCVRCPATYHSFTQCVPAGTKLITASQILCPRHCDFKSGKTPYHVNTAWCFICAKGGTLVCCDTCPTSFHAECLNIPLPEGGYICEDCETGRLPLYGELVWVKLGQYRWWPALVLHPSEIPNNIYQLPHLPGQFAVRFFGMYDHFWVNSGRVFPYQEGDTGNASSRKSSVDNAFCTALRQAQQAYTIIQGIKSKGSEGEELMSSLLPPKYVKLKVNRAIGNAVVGSKASIESGASKCDCNPNSENPCAPETDCLNRMLLTECSPSVCSAGDRCGNQAFEKRLYPPLEPSRTSFRGWGLKTLADIKKGEFVIEYVGEVINEEEFQRRMQRRQEMRDENYYFLTLDKDRMIDAGPKGNVARFMNHSCEPNCETQKWTVNGDVRVGLFALEDISAGSEVTFNYNLACAGDDKKKCLCGTKRCAGYIGAKPLQNEPPPKKPRRTLLKRKYRRKAANTAPQKLVPRKSNKKRGRPSKKHLKIPSSIKGIDRDLAIINQSLLDCSNDEHSMEYDDKTIDNSDINTSYVDNAEKELKTEIEYSANGILDDEDDDGDEKKLNDGKLKRKRSFALQDSEVKGNLSPVNKNKRARSNSVQFNNSVTLIDENDVVTVINDEQNSNESFKVLKLNGDIDYDVKEVSYVVNESTI